MNRLSLATATTVLMMLAISSAAVAQNISLGVHGGYINSYNDAAAANDTSLTPHQGFVLGAGAELELFPSFGFGAGVQYTQKGAKITVTRPGEGTSTGSYNFNYLEIPLAVHFDLVSSPRIYVLGGTTFGTLLSAVAERGDGSIDYRDSLRTSTLSLELGGGIGVPLTDHVQLLGEARYSYGLSDIGQTSGSILSTSSWKPRDLKVTVGVYYSLFPRGDDSPERDKK